MKYISLHIVLNKDEKFGEEEDINEKGITLSSLENTDNKYNIK